MKVRVLYFANARDLATKRTESFTMSDGASVEDLAVKIFRDRPALAKMAKSLRFSVNEELVEEDVQLREGDEVGVLPPVAGG